MTLCNGYEMIVMAVTRDSYSQGTYITEMVSQKMLRTHGEKYRSIMKRDLICDYPTPISPYVRTYS